MDALELIRGAPPIDQVRRFEELLLALPQVDLRTEHVLFGRMSARTIFIPAGTVLTGCLTNCDNLSVVAGDITVTTDSGPRRITGHAVVAAHAGAKRAGVAHADTWWTTLHHTDQTDPAAAEAEMTDEAERLQTRRLVAANDKQEELT